MMEAEKELLKLRILLDGNEYDDMDEYESVLEEYYPDRVFEVAKRAADEGAISGMHLYGRMLAKKAAELDDSGEENSRMLTEAREWVKKAAQGGCWGAMDDLATEEVELLAVPIEEQIAFFKLSGSGGDLDEHLAYLRKHCGEEVTSEQLDKGIKLYDQFVKYAEENGGSKKKMCDCIFP